VANNDTAANRAKNRRVEIILQQGEDKSAAQQISAGQGSAASLPAVPGTRQTGAQAPGVSGRGGAAAPAGNPAAAVKLGGGSGAAAGTIRNDAADKQVSPVKSGSSLGIRAVGR